MKLTLTILVALSVVLAAPSTIIVEKSSPMGFSCEFLSPEISINQTGRDGFISLEMAGSGISGEIGGPNHPIYSYLIELPASGGYEIGVKNYSEREIGISNKPYPRQPPRFKNRPEPDFVYDPQLYMKSSSHGIVEIEEIGILRGHRLARIIFYPVEYQPNGTLVHRERISVRVDFDRPLEPVDSRLRSPWTEHLLGRTLLVPSEIPTVTDIPPHYLVLTNATYISHLGDFIDFKEQQGYKVTAASLDSIGSTDSAIKSFVQAAYDSWTDPPDYLLIVGDVDAVPPHAYSSMWSSHPSDEYYVMVDGGDYLWDIACGRFSVESIAELNAIIDKTIAHGRFDFSSTDWLKILSFRPVAPMAITIWR